MVCIVGGFNFTLFLRCCLRHTYLIFTSFSRLDLLVGYAAKEVGDFPLCCQRLHRVILNDICDWKICIGESGIPCIMYRDKDLFYC